MYNYTQTKPPTECQFRHVKDAKENTVNPTPSKQIVGCLRHLCNNIPDI